MFNADTIDGMDNTMKRLYQAALELRNVEGKSNLARYLNESPQTMTNWEKRGMSKAGMIKAQALIGCRISWLETGFGSMSNGMTENQLSGFSLTSTLVQTSPGKHVILKHPVVGTAQLGDNGYWAEMGYPEGHGDGYIEYPATDEGTYALRCKGDSMAPRIQDGEFVLVSPSHQYINGDEVLIRCKQGRVMVKKYLYKRDGVVHLGSINEAHPVIKLDEQDIDIIHYISGIARRNLWVPE